MVDHQAQIPPSSAAPTAAIKPERWLATLCLLQITFWTLGPWAVRTNPVYDTLESFSWGNLWQWGYDKHPPLAAWLTATFGNLSDNPDLPLYLLAQLAIVLSFIGIWRLAREYLDPHSAVLSVFLLLGILFYSQQAERFTPDTLQFTVWAFLALYCYYAIQYGYTRYWLITGTLTGLALLTKYQALLILAPMALSILTTSKGRSRLKSPAPWLGAGLALVIFAPHLAWMQRHDFPGFHYVDDIYFERPEVAVNKTWSVFLKSPLDFLVNCLGNVLPFLLLCIPLLRTARKNHQPHLNLDKASAQFKKGYLYCIALGPTLLTLMVGALTGDKLVPRWATPYFAWLPLLLLVLLNRKVDSQRFKRTAISCLLMGLFLWGLRISYLYYKPYFRDDYWRADEFIAAREMMAKAEQLWRQVSDSPLPYLGGVHYHVMGMTAYSSQSTIPFSNLTPSQSLWLDEKDFRKKGGIIVVEKGVYDAAIVQKRLEKDYPQARYLGTFQFKPNIPFEIENMKHSTIAYYLLKPEKKN